MIQQEICQQKNPLRAITKNIVSPKQLIRIITQQRLAYSFEYFESDRI